MKGFPEDGVEGVDQPQEQGDGENRPGDRDLRRLKANRTDLEPAFMAVHGIPSHQSEKGEDNTGNVERQCPPAHPLIINQTGNEEDDCANHDPDDLAVPGVDQGGLFLHPAS